MSRRSDPLAALLTVVLVLAVGPATALAQDDPLPADSVLPDLAPVQAPLTSAAICDLAQGQLEADGLCRLPQGALERAEVNDIFGRDLASSLMSGFAPPLDLAAAGAVASPLVDRVTFVDEVRVDAKARKALDRLNKRKGASTVSGKKAKWKSAGIIDIALVPGVDTSGAAALLADDWLVRLTDGDRIRDFGVVGGKDYVADGAGKKQAGIALVDDDAVTLLVPGGIRQAFAVDIVRVNEDGSIIGQHLGGPGSANARIPADGAFAPVVECVDYFAAIDFDSSTNGTNYDLLGLEFVIDTTVLPDFLTPEDVTLDLTLTPRGSRARTARKVEVEGIMPSSAVRRAIAFDIDLSQPALQGKDGYWLTERPFDITSLDIRIKEGFVVPYDPDLATELLDELLRQAGWTGPDENGGFSRDSPDIVAEVQRHAGGAFTSRPLFYGESSCAKDPHFESVVDVCQEPAADPANIWVETLDEPLSEVRLQPGLFPGDLYGCTVLGAGDQLLAAFAMSGDYGTAEAFDPAWVEWTGQLDCVVDDLPLSGASTATKVADCASSMYEGWADDSTGAWAYGFVPRTGMTPAEARAFLRSFASLDADGDGIPDRHDDDLDGDGTPDIDDADDDDDGAADLIDFSVRSDKAYLSLGAVMGLEQMRDLVVADR